MKRILSTILLLLLIYPLSAQLKKKDSVKGKRTIFKTISKKKKENDSVLVLRRPFVLHKLDSTVIINGSKSTAIYDLNTSNLVFKDIKFIDPYSSKSDVYGERKIEIITDEFSEKMDTKTSNNDVPTDSTGFSCVTQSININANSKSFKQFKGAPKWLKPGVVLDIGGFLDGTQTAIIKDRNPIKISTTIATGESVATVEVENPHDNSELNEAINDLRVGSVPANFEVTASEIHSLEELGFQIYGSYHNNLLGLRTSLGLESNKLKEKHYYKLDLTQIMYTLEVDGLQESKVFKEDVPNMQNLVYISRVHYGRRAIVILESDMQLSSREMSANVAIDRLLQGGEVEVGFNKTRINEQNTARGLFYGGDTSSAFQLSADLISGASFNESVETYFNDLESNPEFAVPISYEISNMNDQQLGMRSVFNQTVRTCTPKITENKLLKVTLNGIQSIKSRNRKTDFDLYGIQQYIEYKKWRGNNEPTKNSGMNLKSVKSDIRTFSNIIDKVCEDGKVHTNKIIHGDINHIIEIKEDYINRSPNINNSLTFVITPNLFDENLDSNMRVRTRFRFHSFVKEYTEKGNTKQAIIEDWTYIDADLKLIVQYLLDPNSELLKFNADFYDSRVLGSDGLFHKSNNDGVEIYLAKKGERTLEAPILFNKNNTNTKAVAWYTFELVDE